MAKDKEVAFAEGSRRATLEHKMAVLKYVNLVIVELINRAANHDNSKLESPEVEYFDQATRAYPLDQIRYGTPEYEESKKFIAPALDHHYAVNRHHPQHFPDGIKGMNLIDLIEMLCDWKASTLRQPGGNLLKSIEHNASPKNFNYGPELAQIFDNTADFFEE